MSWSGRKQEREREKDSSEKKHVNKANLLTIWKEPTSRDSRFEMSHEKKELKLHNFRVSFQGHSSGFLSVCRGPNESRICTSAKRSHVRGMIQNMIELLYVNITEKRPSGHVSWYSLLLVHTKIQNKQTRSVQSIEE